MCTSICTRKVSLKSFSAGDYEIIIFGIMSNVKWSFRNCKKSLEQSNRPWPFSNVASYLEQLLVRYNQRIRSFSPRSIVSKHTFPNYPPNLTRLERMKPRIISSLPVCRCMQEIIIQIAILFNFKKRSQNRGQKLLWLEFFVCRVSNISIKRSVQFKIWFEIDFRATFY